MTALAVTTIKERRRLALVEPAPAVRTTAERALLDAQAQLADYWRLRCLDAEARLTRLGLQP